MPLLGGACKMAGAVAAAGDPRFTGDPYTTFDVFVYGVGSPVRVFSGIEMRADGTIYELKRSGATLIGRWDNGLATLDKADYQFRFDTTDTLPGPGLTSQDFNTWVAASASVQAFYIEIDSNGEFTVSGTVRVRKATSPFTEYDTAALSMTVAQEP